MARTLIDHAYRARIRQYPCVVAVQTGIVSECIPPVQACHVDHSGMGGKNVPDRGNLWPGCAEHHGEHHQGRKSFELRRGFSLRRIAKRLQREIEDGVEFPDEPYGVKVAHL